MVVLALFLFVGLLIAGLLFCGTASLQPGIPQISWCLAIGAAFFLILGPSGDAPGDGKGGAAALGSVAQDGAALYAVVLLLAAFLGHLAGGRKRRRVRTGDGPTLPRADLR